MLPLKQAHLNCGLLACRSWHLTGAATQPSPVNPPPRSPRHKRTLSSRFARQSRDLFARPVWPYCHQENWQFEVSVLSDLMGRQPLSIADAVGDRDAVEASAEDNTSVACLTCHDQENWQFEVGAT